LDYFRVFLDQSQHTSLANLECVFSWSE